VQLRRLHHVTCVCSDAQQTLDFYRDELGFALVKKTVNFDDPHSYHLYFGDAVGTPGTLLTFFEWPRADAGRVGRGTLDWLGLATPAVSAETELVDPDGLRLRVRPAAELGLSMVAVVGNPDLYAGLFELDGPLRFGDPLEEPALIGPGTTHHVAWRAADDAELEQWQKRLTELGLRPTPVQDRKYFHSVYFRMPDGMLIEIATDRPGFMVDEPRESLGSSLALPEWLEPERETLERELTPIE
jgi:glyoxalase family protein